MKTRTTTTLTTLLMLSGLVLGTGMVEAGGSCPEVSLTSQDTLPWSDAVTVSNWGSEVNLAALCPGVGFLQDYVVCFTPQNNCSVSAQMTLPASTSEYCLAIATSTCTATPSAVGSAAHGSDGDTTVSTGPQAVSAGMEYCAVFSTDSFATLPLTIQAEGGTDCGALPVTLQSFRIGR